MDIPEGFKDIPESFMDIHLSTQLVPFSMDILRNIPRNILSLAKILKDGTYYNKLSKDIWKHIFHISRFLSLVTVDAKEGSCWT